MTTYVGDSLQSVTTSKPAVNDVVTQADINDVTFKAMLAILDDLTDHTHIFYDDYSTACNCNCNCNCTRGIL